MQVSSFRRRQCYSQGEVAETNLAKLLTSRGSIVQQHPRNTHRNYADKVDLDVVTRSGQHYAVEVKSQKAGIDGHILLEVVSSKGHPGWLQGKADFIAQERPDEWWFYERQKAYDYLLKHYGAFDQESVKRLSVGQPKPIRQWIGREGTNDYGTIQRDIFILIPVDELEKLVVYRLPKLQCP